MASNHGKVFLMAAFILADIGFNSSLDYDTYNDSIDRNYKLGFFGLQVTLQICIFLTLFLAAADTFLFRIGLVGALIRSTRGVLLLQLLYLIFTVAAGAYRVRQLSYGTEQSLTSLWHDNTFIVLSSVQKIVAIPYYIMNIRSAVKLEDPILFSKAYWMAITKESNGNVAV